jgi:plastocyanin
MSVAGALGAACVAAQTVSAATLTVHVTADGHPLSDAVVTAVPRELSQAGPANRAHPKATMVQQSQQFSPYVLPVQVGTVVEFPNRDPFRHHVYSFSPAKQFELKLYGGDQTETVTFDKPGIVALGCNIHDNMLAYIDVVPTPYFGTSGSDGKVEINDLPAGTYTVGLWHPHQKGTPQGEDVVLSESTKSEIHLTAQIQRQRYQRRSGAVDEKAY